MAGGGSSGVVEEILGFRETDVDAVEEKKLKHGRRFTLKWLKGMGPW